MKCNLSSDLNKALSFLSTESFHLVFHFDQIIDSIFFFCESLVLVSWQAFISSLVLKLDFISQPSSKSTLPFAGLQHMQQCQVNFHSIFTSMLWSKWMVHEKWSSQGGLNPRPLSCESSALTTRPQLLPLSIRFFIVQ